MRNKIWVIVLTTMACGEFATGQNVTTLSVTPSELTFRSPDEGMRVLVVGTKADGENVDLSESSQFNPAEPIVKRGAAHTTGGARRRAADRTGFALLQDHTELDFGGCAVRRSQG